MAEPAIQREENKMPPAPPGAKLSPEKIEHFLGDLQANGRVEGTIQWYRRGLTKLYQYLPEDKEIRRGTLKQWRAELQENGYAVNTVNLFIAGANSYLEHEGQREYQLMKQLKTQREEPLPELSRTEYLRLLQAAKILNKEQEYLLVKVFGTTEMPLKELKKVTVEAARSGRLTVVSGGIKFIVRLPECLCQELLDYAGRKGIQSGCIFVTQDGKPLPRASVSRKIRDLCGPAHVDEAKGNPRCLRKMYQNTRMGIENNIASLVEQAYQRQLEEEQLLAGWKDES